MTDHTMWSGAPPWTPTAHSDGVALRTASAFYATVTTWYCNGGELWVPANSGMGLMTLSLRIALNGTLPNLASAPLASSQVLVGDTAGRYSVDWDGIEVMAPDAMWITAESADGQRYLFVDSGSVGVNPVQATDGADLYLAEAAHPRGAYRTGGDPTATAQGVWYGLGIKVSDTPPIPPEELPATGILEEVNLPVRALDPVIVERELVSLTPARTMEEV